MIRGLKLSIFIFIVPLAICAQPAPRAYKAPHYTKDWSRASAHPDHIVLTPTEEPYKAMAVTWRTDTTINQGFIEFAPATAAPKFWRNAREAKAKTLKFDGKNVLTAGDVAHYHTVVMKNLRPGSLYAYRVGDGNIWSEWIQFRTATKEAKPFSFLYVGDAQNNVFELWSRLIREGYRKNPDASFIVHAGDLINDAHSSQQWHEWFEAGGWIHSSIGSVPLPGNHEYDPINEEDIRKHNDHLSVQWPFQFNLPKNGPKDLRETVYYFDYQDVRFVILNTMEKQKEQISWLKDVLDKNPNKWTVAAFHHPIFSASEGRDNLRLRELWQPIFDKYQVDLVIQGHDHAYARGTIPLEEEKNLTEGVNVQTRTGPVYVVSVSGGKMYDLKEKGWGIYEAKRDRAAENTQLIQSINIDNDTLEYKAYTAVGEVYDAFSIQKASDNGRNIFIEKKYEAIAGRRHENTIPYEDPLPNFIRANVANIYKGYTIDEVIYMDDKEFKGYNIQMHNHKERMDLRVLETGEIWEERRAKK